MEVADQLRKVPLFQGLDDENIERLALACRPVSFPPDTKILKMGESGHSLFLIVNGSVRVIYPARSADFVLAKMNSGNFFGEMALLNEMPRSATVESVDDVDLLVLEKEDFRRIITESPPVALQFLEVLSLRIRNVDEQISGLSEQAMRDALTGLLNRRAFQERLREESDRAMRYGEEFALILLDLDRFKAINDTFGHDSGDTVLAWVGRMLTEHTRAADAPFRVGGEEFAILAPATSVEVAAALCERLVETISEAKPPVDFDLRVTMSAGYAACPVHSTSPEKLFNIADRALLKAKEEGRNQVSHPVVSKA